MVRALVGTLLEVGTGKMSIGRFSEILAATEEDAESEIEADPEV